MLLDVERTLALTNRGTLSRTSASSPRTIKRTSLDLDFYFTLEIIHREIRPRTSSVFHSASGSRRSRAEIFFSSFPTFYHIPWYGEPVLSRFSIRESIRFVSSTSSSLVSLFFSPRTGTRGLHGIRGARTRDVKFRNLNLSGGGTRRGVRYYESFSLSRSVSFPRITFKLPTIYHRWNGQRSVSAWISHGQGLPIKYVRAINPE